MSKERSLPGAGKPAVRNSKIMSNQYELDEMIRNAIDTRRPADPTKGELFKSLGNRPRDEEILDLVEAIQGEEDEEDATIVLFSETAPNHILKGVVRSALLDCLDARALHLLLAGAYQNAPAAEEVLTAEMRGAIMRSMIKEATKTCIKCGEEKPEDAFRFSNKAAGTRRGDCTACENAKSRKYYQKNREAQLENKRKYRQANREAIAEQVRKYRQENREAIAERRRKYRQANRAAIAEYRRKHYQENREAELERKRKYHQENREAFRRYSLGRRARKAAAVPNNWTKNLETPGQCYWCGTDITDGHHIDHIKPLKLHGPHADYNMVKTCPSCNNSKKDKHPLVWIAMLVTA